MDIVPVIMEVEERFGISIPDERAWPATVGELYLYLLGRTGRWAQGPCPTSQAFYRLRRTLTTEFGVDRRRVRPATRLCDLFPAASRGADWPRLAAALGLPDLPELPRRRVPTARAFRLSLAAVTAAWWLLYPILLLTAGDDFSFSYGLVIWLLLALLVCEWFGILWVAGSLDYLVLVRIPQIRHLAIHLAAHQVHRSAAGDPVARGVWEELVSIIAAQAGVPAQEIHPEVAFSDLPPDYL
jgi:hypothetical protein